MSTVSRLIDTFIPDHYTLSLELDRLSRKFHGITTIHGTVPEGSDTIALHAKQLDIESVLVNGRPAHFAAGENDELHITQDSLGVGEHVVVVSFAGRITDAMHGLYPCYYEHAGVKRELLATQFESHHAREVFPCIDEPAAKATFDVTLTTEADRTVLGNMPVRQQEETDDRKLITTFETTPRMSTYLLAFVVGELHKATATTEDGVEVNVWATPAQPVESLDFALDIAVRSIEFYNDYFGVAYPLPKSDHVALPDFSSGAMENWGLVTYREIALLADPATTSISSKQYIATVIAHELAHQWFGNLVTMQWWNDLWLNESFATLMEYLAVDALHPEWNIWLDFASNEAVVALRRDALDGVQSVQVDVNHPDEISTLFDGAIVYAKGARLLRMIQHFIGSEAFQAGLKQYFADHAYQNTIGNDLWSALEAASGKPVTRVMNQWVSQSGFPVVTLERHDETLTLRQEQFFVGPHTDTGRTWPIPLASTHPAVPELMESETYDLQLSDPVHLNVGDTAHFITSYDQRSRDYLVERIKDLSLDPISRLQFLDEATLLARGGRISSAELIPVIESYQGETSEPVWGIISLAIGELKKFVEDNPEAKTKLRALAARVARAQFERLGWDAKPSEPEEDTKLRSIVIGLMLYGEDQAAINHAIEVYNTAESLESFDPELRPLILSTVTRHGDPEVVDDLLQLYRNTQSSEIRQDICVGITSTRSPEKIELLLRSIKDSTIVRHQDVARWFVYLVRQRESRTAAWLWVRDSWDWIESTFGGDKSYSDYPRYSASALVSNEQLAEYKDFFAPLQSDISLARSIELGIREIEGRIELIERDKAAVQNALLNL